MFTVALPLTNLFVALTVELKAGVYTVERHVKSWYRVQLSSEPWYAIVPGHVVDCARRHHT